MEISKQRSAALRALPILLLTLCLTGVIGYIAWQTFRSVNVNLAEPVVACDGNPNSSLSPYDETDSVHPTLAFRAGDEGLWLPDVSMVNAAWLPNEPADTQFVLCIDPPIVLSAPVCDSSDTTPVPFGVQQPVRLILGVTGELWAETTIPSVSNVSPDCIEPDRVPVAPPQVTAIQIEVWLGTYVTAP